jgi:hypothetical protein
MLKEACKRRPLNQLNRHAANYYKTIDRMQEALNKNIQENIFPHWR